MRQPERYAATRKLKRNPAKSRTDGLFTKPFDLRTPMGRVRIGNGEEGR